MTRTLIACCCLFLGATIASAAFTEPTAEQIQSAAENPDEIKDLLVDANPAQAEAVIKSVVAAIEDLKLKIGPTRSRIAELFNAAFDALSAEGSLGSEAAGAVLRNVIKSMSPSLVPTPATGLNAAINARLQGYRGQGRKQG